MKRKIILTIIFVLYTFIIGLSINAYAYEDEKVVVLLYHHLLSDSENTNKSNSAVVSVESFEKQMKYLYDNGYNTISIQSLNNHLKFGTPLPRKSVIITFDDGYQSNYVYAYPILKRYRFKASIFLITDLIPDSPEAFTPNRLTYMCKEEIFKSKDIFEFACHTYNLHKLDANEKSILLSSDEKDIVYDLRISKAIIPTKFFSYPYGQYNKYIESVLKKEGFELAFTTRKGVVDKQSIRFELNRVPIFYNTSLSEFREIF